ncbi:MAG: hypothetical protein GF320_22490 [Armatimonadia bacterium]|nr:hypothetical protein [Armatimonadia bacterium]
MESDPRLAGVAAAYGVNLLPGSTIRVGFEIRELTPLWRRRRLNWWTGRVGAKTHPRGRDRIMADGERRQVAEVWISRGTCMGPHGSASRGS